MQHEAIILPEFGSLANRFDSANLRTPSPPTAANAENPEAVATIELAPEFQSIIYILLSEFESLRISLLPVDRII